jgi:hypothetical protein
MASSIPNVRLLDNSTSAKELDLASEVFHRIIRAIGRSRDRSNDIYEGIYDCETPP